MSNAQRTVPEQVESAFGPWQKSLVDTVRSKTPRPELVARQQALVSSAKTSEDLVSYLIEHLAITQEMIDAAPKLEGITEKEMHNTNREWEQHVAKQLEQAHITRQQARSSTWWYICHVAWLQAGTFPNPPNTTFKARLNDRILSRDVAKMSESDTKKLDEATRNLLRWLGGLPHIRGHRRVAEDPPIARAWWRYRIASDAAASTRGDVTLTVEDFHRTLRVNWGTFIERSTASFSSLLAPRALAAVCVIANSKGKGGVSVEHCRTVARRCLQSHPELMDWNTLVGPIKKRTKSKR